MKKTFVSSMLTSVILMSVPFLSVLHSQSPTLQDLGKAIPLLPEITIYTAETFITMDPGNPEVGAVAVIGEKILAVGELKDLEQRAKGQPYRVDHTFDGKIVTPGFLAQHLHPFLGALSMESTIISIEDWALPDGFVEAVRGHDAYIARLTDAVANKADPEQVMFTWGYHKTFHGSVTRKDLDAIDDQYPIFVWHRSCHEFTLNTPALELCGIDQTFLESLPQNTQNMCNLEDGHFWETGAFGVLPKLAPQLATPEQFKHGLKSLSAFLHAQGVTAGCEPGGVLSKPMTELINGVLGSQDTPFRFYFLPDGKSLAEKHVDGDLIGETEKLLNWGEGKCQYLPKQVKLFSDGAIFSQLMQLRDGYTDGHEGEWMMTPDLFSKAFRKYWDADYQIVVHITGDKGLDMFLDNLELNMRRNPRFDHRATVVHFGMAQPDQIATIKRLGALVSGNPYYVTCLSENYSQNGLTPERVRRMVPMKDVEDAGISFSFHSDMPMAPAQPLFLIDCGVNRTSFSGKVWAPEQRVSRMGALRAVTIEAAYSWQMEKTIGSIEAGKLANFTILEENPLTVEASKIKDIPVWGTMLEGKVLPVIRPPASDADKNTTQLKRAPESAIAITETRAEGSIAHGEGHTDCVCAINRQFASVMVATHLEETH